MAVRMRTARLIFWLIVAAMLVMGLLAGLEKIW
jgi:hypothetical protein